MRYFSSREQGFTLLELLLVIGVSAILLLGVSQIARSWAESASARGGGAHLQKVTDVTRNFVEANWSTLTPTADVVTESMNVGSPWNNFYPLLFNAGLLDLNTNQILSPAGTPLSIAYEIDNTIPTQPVMRATIYSTRPLPNAKVYATAREGGAYAGTWLKHVDAAMNNGEFALGAFNQWRLPLAKITAAGAPYAGAAAPDILNGYFLSVVEIAQTQAIGPYLYRQAIGGDPTLNTMSAPLDMNNNNIDNLGSLSVASLDVTGPTTLQDITVTGVSNFAQGLTVQNNLDVTGAMNVAGTTTTNALNVAGTVTTTNLTSATLDTQNLATDVITSATGLTVNGPMTLGMGNSLTAPSVTATTCMNVAGIAYGTPTCP